MTATGITMFQDVAGTIAGPLDHATPAQLAAPSPCTGWTRRDVLNHMIGASGMFAACARGESRPFPDWSVMPDWVGDACRHQLACFTVASPAAAWSALTSPRQTGAYLYGLAAHSSWQPDAPIQFQIAGQYPITGQVRHVQAPCRLSYVLQTGPGDPPLYLTWQIRPSPGPAPAAMTPFSAPTCAGRFR